MFYDIRHASEYCAAVVPRFVAVDVRFDVDVVTVSFPIHLCPSPIDLSLFSIDVFPLLINDFPGLLVYFLFLGLHVSFASCFS